MTVVTTVLTFEPLTGNNALLHGPGGTIKHAFGGAGLPCWAWEGKTTRPWLGLPAGVKVKRVKYPADLTFWSIPEGVRAGERAIRDTPGPLLLAGHSQGAQVIDRLIANGLDPRRVQVLKFGDPLRKFGGYGVGRPEVDGRIGVPAPTDTGGVRVRDVVLRYDGWADWPTLNVRAAIRNADQDRIGVNGKKAIHCYGYRAARLDDPAREVYVEGDTEFILLPHAPLLPRLGVDNIEAGYQRPERPLLA